MRDITQLHELSEQPTYMVSINGTEHWISTNTSKKQNSGKQNKNTKYARLHIHIVSVVLRRLK